MLWEVMDSSVKYPWKQKKAANLHWIGNYQNYTNDRFMLEKQSNAESVFIYFLTLMSLNQSHSALTVRGHRLPEEEPVQADGGTGRSSRDRHCGREHPHPSGQGEKHGDCTHSLSVKSCRRVVCFIFTLKVWTAIRTVAPGLFQSGSIGVVR